MGQLQAPSDGAWAPDKVNYLDQNTSDFVSSDAFDGVEVIL